MKKDITLSALLLASSSFVFGMNECKTSASSVKKPVVAQQTTKTTAADRIRAQVKRRLEYRAISKRIELVHNALEKEQDLEKETLLLDKAQRLILRAFGTFYNLKSKKKK